MFSPRPSRFLIPGAVVAAALVGMLASGCGSTASQSTASQSSGASVVRVTERDFHIAAPAHVAAGNVVFRVKNAGPDDHEFIVVRLGDHSLPLRADGMTVNEESLQPSIVGSLEPGPPGTVRLLRLDLAPGRYALMCNMEGHYMGGMHQEFVAGP